MSKSQTRQEGPIKEPHEHKATEKDMWNTVALTQVTNKWQQKRGIRSPIIGNQRDAASHPNQNLVGLLKPVVKTKVSLTEAPLKNEDIHEAKPGRNMVERNLVSERKAALQTQREP